jgi:hypothetical protein
VKRLHLAGLALLALLTMVVPLASVSAAGSKSWYLDSSTHSVVSSCLRMGNPVTGTGNVNFHKNVEYTWLTDDSAHGAVTFPSGGSWTLLLKTGDDWSTDMVAEVGYWDSSFHAFTGTPTITAMGNGFLQVEISTGAVTVPDGAYLAVRVRNVGKNPHHILVAESKLDTPPGDPGYPLPELASGVLFGLGLAGLGAFVLVRRNQPVVAAH